MLRLIVRVEASIFCMFFSDRSQMTDIHPAYYVAFRHLQCRKGFHEKEVEAQFGNGTL